MILCTKGSQAYRHALSLSYREKNNSLPYQSKPVRSLYQNVLLYSYHMHNEQSLSLHTERKIIPNQTKPETVISIETSSCMVKFTHVY